MDWFESLTGFREGSYEETKGRLKVEAGRLCPLANSACYGIGELELVSLHALRKRAETVGTPSGRLRTSVVTGDVRQMHQSPENAGALFQVASQFNLLEMISPNMTPEHGVTGYQNDRTQGPACAIAAGAATIYRNYFATVEGKEGQTVQRQFDGLADIGSALSSALKLPVRGLWSMQNGYALCTQTGLEAITQHLETQSMDRIDILRGKLRIEIHHDVEVTGRAVLDRSLVSQSFCSALPVNYSSVPIDLWKPFASLVLEAAYEATMWAAVVNAQRGVSNVVLLTLLGGGAFGNRESWIYAAIRRALKLVINFDLEVKLISYGPPSKEILAIAGEFQ
jgi:hypothetical protein